MKFPKEKVKKVLLEYLNNHLIYKINKLSNIPKQGV